MAATRPTRATTHVLVVPRILLAAALAATVLAASAPPPAHAVADGGWTEAPA